MSELQSRTQVIVQEFKALPDWEARYRLLIEKGKKLVDLPEEMKSADALVKGCQSQVWLHAKLVEGDRMELRADSDALLVRGLVSLLVDVYSGLTPREILNSSPDFLKEIGFDNNLSPSRTNGLAAMLKQIRNYAVAFDYMINNKISR